MTLRQGEDAGSRANHTRYRAGQTAGHYESFFLRANEPSRPLAFWVRYTVFNPEGHPEAALGELWAVCFNGDSRRHVAVKREVPIARCEFANDRLFVDVEGARLEPGRLAGDASSGEQSVSWDLTFSGGQPPLFMLPIEAYETPMPPAKSLVAVPMAVFTGSLWTNGEKIDVQGWTGSQNHNWGSRHTDHYAWGQVAGFDNAPDTFLEVATARLKIGDAWTPTVTPLVLRHSGEEFALNAVPQAAAANASFTYFNWNFESSSDQVSVRGHIWAPNDAFVGLRYHNPPGGVKYCLNSKIASCQVEVTDKRTGRNEVLTTQHRAAFEILTDSLEHGVEIRV